MDKLSEDIFRAREDEVIDDTIRALRQDLAQEKVKVAKLERELLLMQQERDRYYLLYHRSRGER